MEMKWTELFEAELATRMLATLVLVGIIFLVRRLLVKVLLGSESLPASVRRRWMVSLRNGALFLTLAVAMVIWIDQLRTVAASMVVIAATLVVATKELLLNLVGFVYCGLHNFIDVGDRIEMDGIRGDVIDHTPMGLTIMELGSDQRTHQYSGRSVFLPNSLFLSKKVHNETHLWGVYLFHTITIRVAADTRWENDERWLLAAAKTVSQPYIQEARSRMRALAGRHSLEKPTVSPRVYLRLDEPGFVTLALRVPVPAKQRNRLEQKILRNYLQAKQHHHAATTHEAPA